jgi:hypothetical protein
MKTFIKEKWYIIIVLLTIGLFCCILNHFDFISLEKEEYLYTFSSIAQCFSGILALVGAYAIFMITSLDSRIDSIIKLLLCILEKKIPEKTFEKTGIDYLIKEYPLPENLKYTSYIKIYNGFKAYRITLSYSTVYLAIILSLIIVSSLILLPFSASFEHFHPKIGLKFIILDIQFAIWGIFETIFFIKKAIDCNEEL